MSSARSVKVAETSPSFQVHLQFLSISVWHSHLLRHIKDGNGSTLSMIGVIQCHDNVPVIIQPVEPISTGFQWINCLFPTYAAGQILTWDDNQYLIWFWLHFIECFYDVPSKIFGGQNRKEYATLPGHSVFSCPKFKLQSMKLKIVLEEM